MSSESSLSSILFILYCENCKEKYTDSSNAWCKPCQINHFKNDFINWTSGNKKINDYIQERQLKISQPCDMVFEWISCDQFNDVKEVGKSSFAIVSSATWKDGPL